MAHYIDDSIIMVSWKLSKIQSERELKENIYTTWLQIYFIIIKNCIIIAHTFSSITLGTYTIDCVCTMCDK